jgi:hypothetical protein
VGFFPAGWLDIQRIGVSSGNRVEKQVAGVDKPTTRLLGFWQRCDNALRGQKGDNVGEFSDPMLKRP